MFKKKKKHIYLSVKNKTNKCYLLSFLKHPEEGCHGADVKGMGGDAHDVVQDTGHFSIQHCRGHIKHLCS